MQSVLKPIRYSHSRVALAVNSGPLSDRLQSGGRRDLEDKRATSHRKLDKNDFGPILLPAAEQSQGKAGSLEGQAS